MHFVRIALAVIAIAIFTSNASAMPDNFTYQGVLNVEGQPYTGTADFQVYLIIEGTNIPEDSAVYNNVQVNEGQFELTLGFDKFYFYTENYELNIRVRAPSGSGTFTELTPNQPIQAVPYAFAAESLTIPAELSASESVPGVTISQANTATHDAVALRVTRGDATAFQTNNFISRVMEVESDQSDIGVFATARFFGLSGIVTPTARDNAIGVFAEVHSSASNLTNPTAVYATNSPAGTRAELATVDHAAEFTGDIYLSGDMTKAYATGTSDIPLPIAFGFINSNGSVATGTPNFSAVWSTTNSQYEILIDDEDYFFNEYVTIVTPISSPGLTTRTNSRSGRLVVALDDRAGANRVQASFSFVVYKPTGSSLIAGQRRAPLQPLRDSMTDAELNPFPMTPAPRPFIEDTDEIPTLEAAN